MSGLRKKLVYILVEVEPLEGSEVLGVYSSEEFARKIGDRLEAQVPDYLKGSFYDLIEMELDAVPEGMTFG